MEYEFDRRSLLGMTAAAAVLGPSVSGRAAEPASLLASYRAVRGIDGGVACWATQGVKYLLVGTRLIPFQRAAVIEAVRFDRTGGLLTSSALEGSFSFDLDGRPSYRIAHPLMEAPVTIKPGTLVSVDYQYEADGAIVLAPSSKTHGTVHGKLGVEPGKGTPAIREEFAGYAASPPVGEPVVSEVTLFRPDPGAASANGFRRASRTTTVVRDWPYPLPVGVSGRLLATYEGRKFDSVDALVADVGAATINAAYPDLIERFRAL